VGILLWSFFLNRGELLVSSAQTPFNLSVNDEEYICTSSPCSYELVPRRYAITFEKDGYFDQTETVSVRRWETTELTPGFIFIPHLKAQPDLQLALPGGPLSSLNFGEKPAGLPTNAKTLQFSPSGQQVLLTIGKERYLYKRDEGATQELSFGASTPATWVGEMLVTLENEGAIQLLKTQSPDGANVVARFQRPLKNAQLLGSPTGEYLLATEEDETGGQTHYLVELASQKRQRLELTSSNKAIKWTHHSLIFNRIDALGKRSTVALSPSTMSETILPTDQSALVEEIEAGRFIFTSPIPFSEEGPQISISIEEVIERAGAEEAQTQDLSELYLIEYSGVTGRSITLTKVGLAADETITRIEYSAVDKKLYLEKGSQIFELVREG